MRPAGSTRNTPRRDFRSSDPSAAAETLEISESAASVATTPSRKPRPPPASVVTTPFWPTRTTRPASAIASAPSGREATSRTSPGALNGVTWPARSTRRIRLLLPMPIIAPPSAVAATVADSIRRSRRARTRTERSRPIAATPASPTATTCLSVATSASSSLPTGLSASSLRRPSRPRMSRRRCEQSRTLPSARRLRHGPCSRCAVAGGRWHSAVGQHGGIADDSAPAIVNTVIASGADHIGEHSPLPGELSTLAPRRGCSAAP